MILINNISYKSLLFVITTLILLLFASINYAEEIPEDFDHDDTNFLLSGAHVEVECSICHIGGVYKGVPSDCEECHSTSNLIATTRKPSEHIESVNTCDNCHTQLIWKGARIEHESVIGECFDCHNNEVSKGKSSDHIQSIDDCKQCHTTRRWKQSGFDHEVITGNCYSCHNHTTAKGKSKKHRLSSNKCDDCHVVQNWKSKSFDHSNISKGCINCHATIVPELPHPKNEKCELCHSIERNWQQVRLEHNQTNEPCVNCHKNRKPPAHFVTNEACDDCHNSISSWISNLRYDHEEADFEEHRVSTECITCHTGNSRVIIWIFSGHRPHCAGCHQSNFNPASHIKETATNTTYKVTELGDCTASCHLYTDATFTVRSNSRNRNNNYHNAIQGRGITAP